MEWITEVAKKWQAAAVDIQLPDKVRNFDEYILF
jgi:hypothetical protein